MKSRSFLGFVAVLLLALLFATPAQAGAYDNCRSSQLPWTTTITNNVPNTLPLGSTVSGAETNEIIVSTCTAGYTSSGGSTCQGGKGWALWGGAFSAVAAYPNVYKIAGMPAGLGVKFVDEAGQFMGLDTLSRMATGVQIRTGAQSIPVRLRIVKIGTVTTGSYTLELQVLCSSNEYGNIDPTRSKMSFIINTRDLTETCSLAPSDVQVTLPPVATRDFTGVGSTLGSTAVSLAFNCAANANGKINFTDANNESNTGTSLTLQTGSTATGVGVRLSNAGNPITFANAGVFNQGATEIAVTNPGSSAAVTEIPLTAQYVQTGASVTPGTVKARAIINLGYN